MSTSGTRSRLLVVDDEHVLVELLRDALGFAGHDVTTASSGEEALRRANSDRPDVIVLDVNLPDIDGYEICRRLRAGGDDVPIVFLTARDAPEDLRHAFSRGGDDFVTKPFSLEELNLRIGALLRRRSVTHEPLVARLMCGPVSMDDQQHRVWVDAEEVSLSPTEYRLLHYLLVNKRQAVSKYQILDHVWSDDFEGDVSGVETYISYLRRKLGDGGRTIHTIRGVGYCMREPNETG